MKIAALALGIAGFCNAQQIQVLRLDCNRSEPGIIHVRDVVALQSRCQKDFLLEEFPTLQAFQRKVDWLGHTSGFLLAGEVAMLTEQHPEICIQPTYFAFQTGKVQPGKSRALSGCESFQGRTVVYSVMYKPVRGPFRLVYPKEE